MNLPNPFERRISNDSKPEPATSMSRVFTVSSAIARLLRKNTLSVGLPASSVRVVSIGAKPRERTRMRRAPGVRSFSAYRPSLSVRAFLSLPSAASSTPGIPRNDSSSRTYPVSEACPRAVAARTLTNAKLHHARRIDSPGVVILSDAKALGQCAPAEVLCFVQDDTWVNPQPSDLRRVVPTPAVALRFGTSVRSMRTRSLRLPAARTPCQLLRR